MCGLQWEFIVYIITVKFPADKYKTGGHPMSALLLSVTSPPV